jgi:antirestriction protein ArdC
MLSKQTRADVYEQITSALITAIEEGTGKFEMPWHTLSSPINAANRKLYRGVNILMLWAAARKHNYSSHEWATYRQWQELGARVRKGERSTLVVFWKFFDSQTEEEQQEETEDTRARPRCFARAYHVFNASQVDGYESKPESLLSESERIGQADAFFQSLPATIKYGGDRAYYSPADDYIQMPHFTQFKTPEAFVSTMCHELSHWSGAKSRLNRDLSGRFGDESYAMEEMIAQISASFLCADLQIRSEPSADDAAYVSNWLTVLRGDRRAIFTAASKAQEAASYLKQLASIAQERASQGACSSFHPSSLKGPHSSDRLLIGTVH